MTNSANDAILGKHLEEAATAIKRYTLAELLTLSQAVTAEIANIQGGASVADFTGATFATGGASGLVPAPSSADSDKYLKGDGTWSTIPVMKGASYINHNPQPGESGLVPQPAGGDHDKFLSGYGSWSSLPQFTGAINPDTYGGYYYDGFSFDGTAGVVPAPQASTSDYDKFLKGDGTWSEITLSGGGGSYPIATSLSAGLMSAEDKQHLDSVFQSSADFADAVLTGVGGDFFPSVDSVSDFMTYKDSNIQFFDNRLKRIIDEDYYAVQTGQELYFNGGQTKVWFESSPSKQGISWSITSNFSNNNSNILHTSSQDVYNHNLTLIKFGEEYGIVYDEYRRQNATTKKWIDYAQTATFTIDSTAQSLKSNYLSTIFSGLSEETVEPTNKQLETFMFQTLNKESLVIASNFNAQELLGGNYYLYTNHYAMWYCSAHDTNATLTTNKKATGLTTLQPEEVNMSFGITEKSFKFLYPKPKFTFNENKVIITESTTKKIYPLVSYAIETHDTTNLTVTGSTSIATIFFTTGTTTPTLSVTLATADGQGNVTTLSPWIEDENNYIANICHSRKNDTYYFITFKKGEYNYSPIWYDNCSDIWFFDRKAKIFTKTRYKLSEIIDELEL